MNIIYKIAGTIWKLLPRRARQTAARVAQVKFTASAAGIITNDRGQVLLLNHLLRPLSGWGVPGGFFEAGEQAEAALRRELREETGIALTDVRLYRCRTFRRHLEVMFLAVAVGEPEVKSREIIELGWFDIDDMPPEMNLDQQFVIRRALGVDD